jgi:hypothetical protein
LNVVRDTGRAEPMSDHEIPEDVLRFLESCIDSVEQLQILLLLHSEPERSWTSAQISRELRSTDTSIEKRVEGLYVRDVLRRPPEKGDPIRFRPGTPELAKVIQRLSEQNQKRPYRVIDAIYSHPRKALKAFADAFKFKGGDE